MIILEWRTGENYQIIITKYSSLTTPLIMISLSGLRLHVSLGEAENVFSLGFVPYLS